MPRPLPNELSGSLHWQGKVYLEGDVFLAEGAELEIAPGTEVIFLPSPPSRDRNRAHPYFPGSELVVRGSIRAVGSPEAPITFRFQDPDAPAGSWGGINLEGSPEAVFRYCRFQQADSALHSRESQLTVERSHFTGNKVGIRFHNTVAQIRHNLLEENGAAIRFHFGSPQISRNTIRNNDKGLFITSYPRDYRIELNNFVANRSYQVVLGESVPDQVDLRHNYWGIDRAEAIAANFFDGRVDSFLGEIRFRPFLTEPVKEAGIAWNR